MSSTIYGGKTRNGVIIQDMVDDNRDYVYRNKNLCGFAVEDFFSGIE